MKGKAIPVVLAADSNYEIALRVAIASIMIAARIETQYEVIVITDNFFDETNIEALKKKFPRLKVKIVRLDRNGLKKARVRNEGLSIFTYARLLIPEILSDYEKCIYIDTDVVVLDDLTDLYSLDMQDFYVAGVKDYGLQTSEEYSARLMKSLKIESMNQYLNAGVLLMNLKKLRENHISELFVENLGEKWDFEDQDIINKCCYGKILTLPVRYNLLYRYYKRGEFWEKGFYTEKDVLEAQERPVIVHYTGRNMKPWKFVRSRAAGLWWKAASEALTKMEYEDTIKKAWEFEHSTQWSYIIEKCQNKETIIWGASEKGAILCKWLLDAGIKVKCFCDNDEKKIGMRLTGIVVKSLKKILDEDGANDCIFIVASQAYFGAIEDQLKTNGISNFVRFFFKTEFYYMALDEQFFEEELKEIEEKERIKRENFSTDIRKKYWMDRWIYR